jgi:hypothetical protein
MHCGAPLQKKQTLLPLFYLKDFTEQNNILLFWHESNLIIFVAYQNTKL